MRKKRDHSSIFDAIEQLDTQDRRADRKRLKETSAEKKRAREVQTQSKIYNCLLESRILLQRAINNVGSTSVSGEHDEPVSSFRETCNTLLDELLRVRNELSGTHSKTYDGLSVSSISADLYNSLQHEYDALKENWKNVLNRRHKNLRLHSGVTAKTQFRIMNSSFWDQVEARMEYEEIRNRKAPDNNTTKNNEESISKFVLFDDSKVYQQLLKDFVANSSTETDTERMRVSTKYNNNDNNGKKRDVDRRASKGRKIRYKEIPKLVNFTFPLSRPITSNLNQEDYFQSLFGGTGVK